MYDIEKHGYEKIGHMYSYIKKIDTVLLSNFRDLDNMDMAAVKE